MHTFEKVANKKMRAANVSRTEVAHSAETRSEVTGPSSREKAARVFRGHRVHTEPRVTGRRRLDTIAS